MNNIELSFLDETEYLNYFNQNIYNNICDNIVPYLSQFDDPKNVYYKEMIEKLYDEGYTDANIVYNNIGAYLVKTLDNYEQVENEMKYVRNELKHQLIQQSRSLLLMRRMLDIMTLNDTNNINYDELEDVKLIVEQDKLDKIPLKKYSELITDEIKCAICINEFKNNDLIRDIKCKHIFHKECIDKWLKEESYKCPNCKCQIAEYKPNTLTSS